jgi:hypothetical protein
MRATIVESIVLLLLGLALASVVFESIDRRRGAAIGAADAERDLAAGRIGLKGLGKPMYWTRDYKELLLLPHIVSDRLHCQLQHGNEAVLGPERAGPGSDSE